ncbi:hypothetical protein MPER_05460 [Moniliophthora perniciosa FA553]|nr:hypothetical protein MPER_05460 [Moniliophthora perniciosa FA553]
MRLRQQAKKSDSAKAVTGVTEEKAVSNNLEDCWVSSREIDDFLLGACPPKHRQRSDLSVRLGPVDRKLVAMEAHVSRDNLAVCDVPSPLHTSKPFGQLADTRPLSSFCTAVSSCPPDVVRSRLGAEILLAVKWIT